MKTDVIDAEHLSMLLRLDVFIAVIVPGELTEAARDLVRARHRLSKLLLRRGTVSSGGQAWVGARVVWLGRQRFDSPLVQAAFDQAYDTVVTVTVTARRVIEQRWPLRCAADRFNVSVMTTKRWADRYEPMAPRGCGIGRADLTPAGIRPVGWRRERRVAGLRVSRRWGPVRIAYHLGMNPAATVHRVLT